MNWDAMIVITISFIIVVYLIFKYYYHFQIALNPSLISSNTAPLDLFPVEGDLNRYMSDVKIGETIAATKSVVIASLVRDVQGRIPDMIRRVEEVGRLFKDYSVLIVENDSTDDTRKLLLEWSKINSRVTILGCGLNRDECHIPNSQKTIGHGVDRRRIQKMVDLRNIYLAEVKRMNKDYLIVWDLDMIGRVYEDGIFHAVQVLERTGADMVGANGFYRWFGLKMYYDTYALRFKDEPFHVRDKHLHDLKKGFLDFKRGSNEIEVDSAFAGFAIYRLSSLMDKDIVYDMDPDSTNVECEHVRLNKKLRGKKILDPSLIHLVFKND